MSAATFRLRVGTDHRTGRSAIGNVVVPESDNAKPRQIDADALMRYFEQLSEEANPAHEKFRYVLALLLLQKKKLKLDGSRVEDQTEFLQLSGRHGEGNFEVRDHQLDTSEVQNLQQQLNTHMSQEWN